MSGGKTLTFYVPDGNEDFIYWYQNICEPDHKFEIMKAACQKEAMNNLDYLTKKQDSLLKELDIVREQVLQAEKAEAVAAEQERAVLSRGEWSEGSERRRNLNLAFFNKKGQGEDMTKWARGRADAGVPVAVLNELLSEAGLSTI
jgi:hypothetical protein